MLTLDIDLAKMEVSCRWFFVLTLVWSGSIFGDTRREQSTYGSSFQFQDLK